MVPLADLDAEALRLGRVRRHRGSGTWSARFVLGPGPDGEEALSHVEDLAVCMGRAGGLDPDGAVFVGVALREAVVNAFRHGRSTDGAPTRIGLHLTYDSLVITVRDRGPGIPDYATGRLFEKFYSTPRPGGRKGTGLGLSIVYSIVKRLGGTISVQSEPGTGTDFTIVLPYTPPKELRESLAEGHAKT